MYKPSYLNTSLPCLIKLGVDMIQRFIELHKKEVVFQNFPQLHSLVLINWKDLSYLVSLSLSLCFPEVATLPDSSVISYAHSLYWNPSAASQTICACTDDMATDRHYGREFLVVPHRLQRSVSLKNPPHQSLYEIHIVKVSKQKMQVGEFPFEWEDSQMT